jgi:hypothetical protein
MIRCDDDRSLVAEWKEALEAHLGRELGEPWLNAGDFPRQDVEIRWPDGSLMRFHYSFVVVDRARKKFVVFTEHCGYWEFPCDDFVVKILRQEHIELTDD